MHADRSGPFSPKPVSGASPDFLPAYLSNGVIGLRVRDVPLLSGVAVLNGLAAEHPVSRVECTPHAPYPLAGDIVIGVMRMSDFATCVRPVEQRYDFECGELTSRFVFVADQATAEVTVTTFCSRTMPTVVAQQLELTVDAACDLEVDAMVDPRTVPGSWIHRLGDLPGDEAVGVDGALLWETLGGRSRCGMAYATSWGSDGERSVARWDADSPLVTRHAVRARRGRRYSMTQLVSMVPSPAHEQAHLAAIRLVAQARAKGFDRLRAENRAAWGELWKGRVNILGGDDRWQRLLDAAFFYLHTSVHQSSLASTHPFGLAQWNDYHYYFGHVMWDIEVFALPVLLLTYPNAVSAALDYRFRSMTAAARNACLHGFQGLQFPWQSSPQYGQEAAPGAGEAAAHEHHVTPNVALAFAKYVHATGDLRFARDRAWPVLHGVATWIESRVTETERGFEIPCATGIAERQATYDNSAYVNLTAKSALLAAIHCAERLGEPAPARWAQIAERIVVPINERTGVILDHDGYSPKEEKGATPAPLAALFPGSHRPKREVEEATLRFYLALARDYLGSPMLSALYPTWACRLGDRQQAARFLEDGYAAFTSERFMNVHEYRTDKFPEQPVSGPFIANIAGLLLNCYFGFTGLELNAADPQTWSQRPVVMPAGWDGIEVERVMVRGRPARLIARHGEGAARLELSAGSE